MLRQITHLDGKEIHEKPPPTPVVVVEPIAENEMANLNKSQERQKVMMENIDRIKMRQELFYEH